MRTARHGTERFSQPAPFTFGTTGRNIIEGPGSVALDLSLPKVLRITERQSLEFRAEAFSFPIRAPEHDFATPAFGTIRGGGPGREIQFGLKYPF